MHNLQTRLLRKGDISQIVTTFAEANWLKPSSTFEKYLEEQVKGERIVWLAFHKGQLAGYVTLKWHSRYQPFFDKNIPEIKDLNVLPPFRKHGIGSHLLDIAEEAVREKSSCVGIGVGLYDAYGEAQRIYVKRGYIPDGLGITQSYQPIEPGSLICFDDTLVMWFTKFL